MGNVTCRQRSAFICFHGLYGAGKSSLVYQLKYGRMLAVIPSIIMNDLVETVDIDGTLITCWDMGGRIAARPQIRERYSQIRGFVYVIDSADRDRLDESLDELIQSVLLVDETRGAVVMVLANKQDLAGALTAEDVESSLRSKYTFSEDSASCHTVFVRPCSVLTMDGVLEAFQELTQHLCLKRAGKAEKGLLPYADRKKMISTDAADGQSVVFGSIKRVLRDPVVYFNSLFRAS